MWYQVQQDYVNELMNVTHVPFQATRCTKSFIAHIAFVRLLIRVNTHVSGQLGWSCKHLLANIAFMLLRSLSLHSFSRSHLFFSYLFVHLIIIIIRYSQTQHLWFFFLSLQDRPRVHRSFRMWILSSSSHYYFY